nr:bacterial transcriptional activator domain-containing protein [Micromonospora sp. DSM 115978]
PRAPATVLVSAPPGYAVRLPAEAVDAWWFERRVRDGLSAGVAAPAAAAAAFDEALALWRGTPYAEVADEPWAFGEVGRLAELRRVAQERRAEVAISLGSADVAVGNLEALLADHPGREEAWRLLALALYAT